MYSCFTAPAKPTIYLTNKTISGTLLNSNTINNKEDFNNKIITESFAPFSFD